MLLPLSKAMTVPENCFETSSALTAVVHDERKIKTIANV
jgi:hypothetical protein